MQLKNNQKKFLFTGLIIICAGILLASNYEVMRNHTESLPYKFVVLEKRKIPTKRDQVFAFKVYSNAQYHNEKPLNFIKVVGGLAGDKIEVRGGEVYYDGIEVKDEKNEFDFYYNFNLARITNPQELEKRKVTIKDKEVIINGKLVGAVKPFTTKFENYAKNYPNLQGKFGDDNYRLHAIPSGVIPSRKFFAYTPHKDSFDSRYQEIGLIDEKDIIGTAILTF